MSACNLAAVQNCRNLVPNLHIVGTGNDLNSLTAYVDLTDNQLVSVRMRSDLFDLSNYYVFKIFIKCVIILNLGSGESHGVAELLVSNIQARNICFNP